MRGRRQGRVRIGEEGSDWDMGKGQQGQGSQGKWKRVRKELDTGEQLTGTGVQHGKVKKMLGGDGDGVMKWLRGNTRRKTIIMDRGGVGEKEGGHQGQKKEKDRDKDRKSEDEVDRDESAWRGRKWWATRNGGQEDAMGWVGVNRGTVIKRKQEGGQQQLGHVGKARSRTGDK